MKKKRIIITVRPTRIKGKWRHWEIREPDGGDIEFNRVDAIDRAKKWARDWVELGERAQVRVFNRQGRVSTEWTYPRSSDPKKSKG